ncbi:MAG: prephenate dehydrogenase/arogenate dehydrogenase family protein, partial [Alphaproteobacteria bacterium]
MSKRLFERVALIGLGLEGSSLGHVMKRESLAGHIAGCARTQATLDKAIELGFVDSVDTDPAAVVADADLVVLCTPVSAFGDLAAKFRPALKPGA